MNEETIVIETGSIRSTTSYNSVEGDFPYIPQDAVFSILEFLPFEYEDITDVRRKYPFLNCNLVSKTWHLASCDDKFWKSRLEKLAEFVKKEYNWDDELRMSIYKPRYVTNALLVKKHFNQDSKEIKEAIDRQKNVVGNYRYYNEYVKIMKKLYKYKPILKAEEHLRTKVFIYLKSLFILKPLVYILCFGSIAIFSTIGIELMHFMNNDGHLTLDDYYKYNLILLSSWVSLLVILFLVVYQIIYAVHLKDAQKTTARWKYQKHEIHSERTVKNIKKNSRNKVFGYCIVLSVVIIFCFDSFFIQASYILGYENRFVVFFPFFLVSFLISSQDILFSLFNGGMLMDSFPMAIPMRRVLIVMVKGISAGGIFLFFLFLYYAPTHGFNPLYFLSLIISHVIFIALEIITLFSPEKRHLTGAKHIENYFFQFKNPVLNYIFRILSLSIPLTLCIGYLIHIFYLSEAMIFQYHLILYNLAVIETCIICVIQSFIGREEGGNFSRILQEVKYNSDYDSEYAM